MAELADVPEAVHYLDELGLYLIHSVDKPLVLTVISSEVSRFLEDEDIFEIVDLLVATSSLIGIRSLYRDLKMARDLHARFNN